MKTIGLLGGTSWPSTFSYYEMLNRAAQRALGGHHSAKILLYSIDYHTIKSHYHDGWDEIPALLENEIRFLLEKKPDCLILCNNTLHRAFDQISKSLALSIPVFHAGHLSAEAAKQRGHKTALLLGTRFTMEDGFFAKYFIDKHINIIVPHAEDRARIQEIQKELARGNIDSAYRQELASMLKHYPDVDSIVLACTELPLVIDEHNSPKPLINPVQCQCDAAAQFAFIS